MRGGGLSADSEGSIYGATADGPFAASTNFGQSILKFTQSGSDLTLADWFTPYNELYLDQNDMDLSEPVLVLPDQTGKIKHLMAAIGKEGTIYLLNRDNLGHFCATCTQGDTQIVQELPTFAPEPGALAYWNNTLYAAAAGSPIRAIALNKGKLATTPFAQSVKTDNGHSPLVTANGTTSGLLWQISGSIVGAYDALTLQRLYVSSHALNNRDQIPPLPHFANFVVANGKVYVGTNNSLVVFGSLP
jgi:hypothetical protein